jgi:hypothetical protein
MRGYAQLLEGVADEPVECGAVVVLGALLQLRVDRNRRR